MKYQKHFLIGHLAILTLAVGVAVAAFPSLIEMTWSDAGAAPQMYSRVDGGSFLARSYPEICDEYPASTGCPCSSDDMCQFGLCLGGVCSEWEKGRECSSGKVWQFKVGCIPIIEHPDGSYSYRDGFCTSNSDCKNGGVCIASTLYEAHCGMCGPDAPCGSGEVCGVDKKTNRQRCISANDKCVSTADETFQITQDAYDAVQETWDEAQTVWEDAQEAWNDAKETYADVKAAYAQAAAACKNDYAQSRSDCADEETTAERKTCLASAKSERTACLSSAKAEALEGKSVYVAAQAERKVAKSAYAAAKTAWRSAERTFKAAQKTYDKATKACDS